MKSLLRTVRGADWGAADWGAADWGAADWGATTPTDRGATDWGADWVAAHIFELSAIVDSGVEAR